MDHRARHGLLGLAALAAVATPSQLSARQRDSVPAGVTVAMLKEGKKLFAGEGLCTACHGPDGKGTVGPNLTDSIWLHGRGSYEEIITRILEGVPGSSSKSGIIMPPKGGSRLKDEQVKAVAAYVWSLSRKAPVNPGAPPG